MEAMEAFSEIHSTFRGDLRAIEFKGQCGQCNDRWIHASFTRTIPNAVAIVVQTDQYIRLTAPHCRQYLSAYQCVENNSSFLIDLWCQRVTSLPHRFYKSRNWHPISVSHKIYPDLHR